MYLHTFTFENSILNLSSCLQDTCKLTNVASPFHSFFLLSAITALQIASRLVQYYPDVTLAVTVQFPAKSLLMSAFKTFCE